MSQHLIKHQMFASTKVPLKIPTFDEQSVTLEPSHLALTFPPCSPPPIRKVSSYTCNLNMIWQKLKTCWFGTYDTYTSEHLKPWWPQTLSANILFWCMCISECVFLDMQVRLWERWSLYQRVVRSNKLSKGEINFNTFYEKEHNKI